MSKLKENLATGTAEVVPWGCVRLTTRTDFVDAGVFASAGLYVKFVFVLVLRPTPLRVFFALTRLSGRSWQPCTTRRRWLTNNNIKSVFRSAVIGPGGDNSTPKPVVGEYLGCV